MLNGVDFAACDLNLLVLFQTVFEERQVASAAGRLHVSPSAVSHGLRRLRRMFGDPLFVKGPKGVVPTARAAELATPIADILGRVQTVLGQGARFDPGTSTRRFRFGASDATSAVFLPRLLARLRETAPGVDLAVRHLLPTSGFEELESNELDVIVLPLDEVPARLYAKVVCEEEFVVVARRGHPFLEAPSLRRYCELRHVVVSIAGDSQGYLDGILAERGLTRRVALTVPNFMLALAALSTSDLVAALPASIVEVHGVRFGLERVRVPLPLRRWQLRAVATKAAMQDAGIAWLFDEVSRVATRARGRKARSP